MRLAKIASVCFGLVTVSVVSAADAPAQVQDRAAIQNLIVRYTIALDTLDADLYASVFTEDAVFSFGGNTYTGREQIRGIVTGIRERNAARPASDTPAPKSYHAITNTLVEFVSDREARHQSYWQTISGPSSGPFNVGGMGVYKDTLVKRNGEWLIQKREIVQ